MEAKKIPVAELYDDEGPPLEKTLFECICPKCGIRHNTYLCWNGRGAPRKFCRSCRDFAQNTHFDTFFSLNTQIPRQ
jgi:hypothetical protein